MKKNFLSLTLALLCLAAPAYAATFAGVTSNNELVTFDSANPGTFISSTPITGLKSVDGVSNDPNAVLMNLTYNHNTGIHFGVDSNGNFYSVSLSGAATLVDNTFAPVGFSAGLAWDPFTDKMLFASDAAENILIASNGIRTANANLVYGTGDSNFGTAPTVFAVAIDPFTGEAYFADSNTGTLSRSFDPNFSELFTVGSFGTSFTSFGGMVVDAEDGSLWAAFSVDGLTSKLYSIDTASGLATEIGSFANNSGLHSVSAVPEPHAIALAAIGSVALLAWRRRRSA